MNELVYCIESSLVLDKPSVISGLKDIASGNGNRFGWDENDILEIMGIYEDILDSYIDDKVEKTGRIRVHNSGIEGMKVEGKQGNFIEIETILEKSSEDLKYVGIDINYEGIIEASLDYVPGDNGDIKGILNYEHPRILLRTKIPEQYESLANNIFDEVSSANLDIEEKFGKSFLKNRTELYEKDYKIQDIEEQSLEKAYV